MMMQGFVASGIAFSVQIWCIDRGGLCLLQSTNLYKLLLLQLWHLSFLGNNSIWEGIFLIHFFKYMPCFIIFSFIGWREFCIHGRIFGAILIIIGLYLVLWGKSEEKRLGLLQAKSSMVPENQPDNMDQSATLIINNSNGIKPNTSSSLIQPLLLDTSYKTVNIPSPSDEPQP